MSTWCKEMKEEEVKDTACKFLGEVGTQQHHGAISFYSQEASSRIQDRMVESERVLEALDIAVGRMQAAQKVRDIHEPHPTSLRADKTAVPLFIPCCWNSYIMSLSSI